MTKGVSFSLSNAAIKNGEHINKITW